MIDRMLIGRALTNVIENALHAMPGGGTLTIDAALAPDHMVQLRVTDTGIGMDAGAIAKIFEPYFSTKAIGTGLGLTIAKRNVEANQGTIAVTSAEGPRHQRHDDAAAGLEPGVLSSKRFGLRLSAPASPRSSCRRLESASAISSPMNPDAK